MTAYGRVGPPLSYTGLVRRGCGGASPAPSKNIMTSPTSKSSSGGMGEVECRIQLGHPSRVRGPCGYAATSIERRVLRACSRAGALLWREVADAWPVNSSVSSIERGRPDLWAVRHSIKYQ